ncbi:MAG: polyprenyl synthetase family protein [Bacteroidaceae bacterium]|nr:polyprenyl synthetase family protein [Bacteroidaceae bacterium]
MLNTIRKPIASYLESFNSIYKGALHTDNELLAAALTHVTRKTGKQMRPTLVMLCAREGGEVSENVLHAAAGLELLHLSSLVHDDVVDESDMRRGQRSVNSLWDNKAAVLVGDFIVSAALSEVARTRTPDVVERVAWLGQTLADGELEQLNNTHRTNFSEEGYYRVIAKKTAALFSSCAYIGALLGGADAERAALLERFGYLAGLCFQLRDDIFDLDDAVNVGKPTGNDLNEGKLTLPVLHAITEAGSQQLERIALKVRAREASKLEIQELVDATRTYGGVTYANKEMDRLRHEAVGLLRQLKDLEVASSLKLFVDYVVERSV